MNEPATASNRGRDRLTACLIVQDEQERLPSALDSVGFCDEIIVVDGGSTDGTVEIARERGAHVIENPWPGFAAQRNVALDAATSEWVFELDADERISPRLRASILALLADPPQSASVAVCPLRNRFLGRWLGPSAKYPAYRSRLFKRGVYRHDESREVHEGIEPRERPAVLDGDLEHELAATLHEALRDTWRYARLESAHIPRSRAPSVYLKGIVLRPAAKVAYRMIIDGSWRDGLQGVLKIVLDASSDALVWTRVLLSTDEHTQAVRSRDGRIGQQHFGRRPAGPPKVVGLAGSGPSARAARRWLADLKAADIDVTLISSDDALDEELPERPVRRLHLLATMRALDIEMQLRTIDAVVPFGHCARLIWRTLPRTLRPEIAVLATGSSGDAAAELVYTAVAASRPA